MTIEELNLIPEVKAKAQELQHKFPYVQFTSGRRTLAQQSVAMAANIVASGNRRFIAEVYAHSAASTALQAAVDAHSHAVTATELTSVLYEVFQRMPIAEREQVSKHLVGKAFDVAPNSCPLSALEALHPEKLLTHEGNLARWHVQWT